MEEVDEESKEIIPCPLSGLPIISLTLSDLMLAEVEVRLLQTQPNYFSVKTKLLSNVLN